MLSVIFWKQKTPNIDCHFGCSHKSQSFLSVWPSSASGSFHGWKQIFIRGKMCSGLERIITYFLRRAESLTESSEENFILFRKRQECQLIWDWANLSPIGRPSITTNHIISTCQRKNNSNRYFFFFCIIIILLFLFLFIGKETILDWSINLSRLSTINTSDKHLISYCREPQQGSIHPQNKTVFQSIFRHDEISWLALHFRGAWNPSRSTIPFDPNWKQSSGFELPNLGQQQWTPPRIHDQKQPKESPQNKIVGKDWHWRRNSGNRFDTSFDCIRFSRRIGSCRQCCPDHDSTAYGVSQVSRNDENEKNGESSGMRVTYCFCSCVCVTIGSMIE